MARGNKKPAATKAKPQKQSRPNTSKEIENSDSTQSVPLALQQKCLDIFQRALKPGEDDTKVLQEVKGHLYNRDFAAAFGQDDYLRVYASRWSPSRALGYLQVLIDVQDVLFQGSQASVDSEDQAYKTVCLGGGAGAEVVALAAWIHRQDDDSDVSPLKSLQADFVDIAAWQNVVSSLHEAVTTPQELSKYASAAAREANIAMVPGNAYSAKFDQIDVLALDLSNWQERLNQVDLVTLMFTLNELYSTSMAKTQKMLAHITDCLAPGAHLLVVDSPGSYSTVSINGAEKRYPMHWLLDFTLIGSQQSREDGDVPAKWEKLVSDESKWFRLLQGLRYAIELENMRYQIHLYRRLPD
ncbi:hypothetical protein M409DRAFT_18298 [Zasmidium cellare ATCC 36951]|uniref:25S rRNA (Uridine(2843)-N(3))-methyltransferase n=1 Tax=Zasmidium cellare ATCC 36951 TaxID=1080233 RepID=A0A6A6CVN8_ZASCE|nr:uncharacterized protein M409DRAFT_18298 [Zasmidium cellare ATCC 36951]KAF2171181.1 hypothetical protein M409DRAFT_18298 [Zasmidium cellare ATCC 36951]